MNRGRSNDSEVVSEGCPSLSISTAADLQVKAYENRVRERVIAKYPKRPPAESRQLEKQIQKLVQIYAEGRILLRGDPRDCVRRNHHPKRIEQTREIEIADE